MEDIMVGFGSKIKMSVHIEPFGDVHANRKLGVYRYKRFAN